MAQSTAHMGSETLQPLSPQPLPWAQIAAFAAFMVIWFAVTFDALSHMAGLWWYVDTFSHGLVVPFVSAALLYGRRERLSLLLGQPDYRFLIAIAAFSGLWGLGEVAEARLITHIAAIGILIAAIPLFWGRTVFKDSLFAFLFLFAAVPVGEEFIPFLQIVTADASVHLLKLIGVSMRVEGVLIYTDFGTFEVARACAGVRFFLTSAVVGLLLTHLLFNSLKRKSFMMAIALVVPIIANIIRVVTIILIAKATDISFATDVDHVIYGWIFLSIVLFLVISFAYRIADKPANAPAEEGGLESEPTTQNPKTLAAVFFTTVLVLVSTAILTRPQTVDMAPPTLKNPLTLACTDCLSRRIDPTILSKPSDLAQGDAMVGDAFRVAGQIFHVSRIWYRPDYPFEGRIVKGTTFAPSRWHIVSGLNENLIDAHGNGWTVRQYLGERGQRRLAAYRLVYGGDLITGRRSYKVAKAIKRLRGQAADAVITMIILDDFSEWEEGLDALQTLLRERPLREYQPDPSRLS